MAIAREAAYAALFARMKTVAGVKLFLRRMRTFDQLAGGQQPALLCIAENTGVVPTSDGLPTRHKLRASIYIVAPPDPGGDAGETTLLTLIDRVDAALDRPSNEPGPQSFHDQDETTLGGVVLKAYISGDIEIDAGLQAEQGIARVPVEMLLVG